MTDPEPEGKRSPLRTYLECLRRTPADATHRLIVQDDTRPVRDFHARASAALERAPEGLTAFYVSGAFPQRTKQMRKAIADGEPFIRLWKPGYVPTVATAWTPALIEAFLEWLPSYYFPNPTRDDGAVGTWAKKAGILTHATAPCLVQHPDEEPALMGRRPRAGANRARVAAVFVDD